MPALVAALVSSASLGLIFRHTGARGYSRLVVTAANYATATLVALVLHLLAPGVAGIPGRGNASEPSDAAAGGLGTAGVALAVAGGMLFVASFILYQRAVHDHGAGTAGMYGKLGVLVPMLLSILVWQELPAPLSWLGIALAVAAIVISQARRVRAGPGPGLLLLLVTMGLAEFTNKVFERYLDDANRLIFLGLLFGTAFVTTVVFAAFRRVRPRRVEILWGVAVGLPNLFSSFFLIAALAAVPAAVAFPVFSAGSIALIVVGALIIFGDTPSRTQWLSLGLTAGALVLVNL